MRGSYLNSERDAFISLARQMTSAIQERLADEAGVQRFDDHDDYDAEWSGDYLMSMAKAKVALASVLEVFDE